MKRIEGVWGQLSKRTPKKLSKQSRKVNLSAQEDLNDLNDLLLGEIDKAINFYDELTEVNYAYQRAVEAVEDLFSSYKAFSANDYIKEGYALRDKIEKASAELGVEPGDTFDGFFGLVNNISEMEDLLSKIQDEYYTTDWGSIGLRVEGI